MTTKSEYRAKFRTQLRDNLPAAYLWSDDEVDNLVQLARTEAAIRSKLIQINKRARTDLSVIPLVSGQYEYHIDPSIFWVKSVVSSIHSNMLEASYEEEFNNMQILVRSRAAPPELFYVDEDGVLIVDSVPLDPAGATLTITGYKRPDPLLTDDSVDLEIVNENDRNNLMYYAYSLAYEKQDSEAEHIQKAQYFAGMFDKCFEARVSADSLRRRGVKKVKHTKGGWF